MQLELESMGQIGLCFSDSHITQQNLELLWPGGPRVRTTFAHFRTVHEISASDIEQITNDLANLSGRYHAGVRLNRMKCQALFHEYNRTLEM